ncbi:hypothetical protein QFC19_009262 [Naganishia cerealis]|uniref:Uncharacterized protein n=1 Tax=Naganishia cerealis TaxID=610337 RepID=A0ACC2UVN2_9TREE|nr:hypothetical protein QFC19_009262 [Naganishia cerealis]
MREKSPAAGGVSSVFDNDDGLVFDGAAASALVSSDDQQVAVNEDAAMTAWTQLFQNEDNVKPYDDHAMMMWIPSGLGLDLGFTQQENPEASFLPTTSLSSSTTTTTTTIGMSGMMSDAAPNGTMTTTSSHEFYPSPSTGIMQTLFDHDHDGSARTHLDLLVDVPGTDDVLLQQPPLSAISSSDFMIPGFLDFPTSAPPSGSSMFSGEESTMMTAGTTTVAMGSDRQDDDDDGVDTMLLST